MAGAQLTGNWDSVVRRLHVLAHGRWRVDAAEESGEYMIASTAKALDTEGIDVHGKRFEPLDKKYVERPRNKGGRGGDRRPILIREGAMIGSLGLRRKMKGVFVGPLSAKEAIIGLAHQLGKGVPLREWIGFRKRDLLTIPKIFAKHAKAILEGRGK